MQTNNVPNPFAQYFTLLKRLKGGHWARHIRWEVRCRNRK